MSRKIVKMLQVVAASSLAGMLGLWTPSGATAADAPAVAASQSNASPGATAIEKAAKDNKYLFIFFFTGQDAHTGAMNGVFQTAMAKMTDRADSMAINVADPAEKPIVDKFGVRGAPMPLVLGNRSHRGCHPSLSEDVRRGPTATGVRQPMHGQVHEGHSGPTFDPALRAE